MTDIVRHADNALVTQNIDTAFADFLRLNVANGDASAKTIANYQTEVKLYSAWCEDAGINPARAGEDDLRAYRAHLVEAGYARSTIATKLNSLRRFYEAAVWRGLRPDNPVAGIRAPKDRQADEDKIKFLPLAGFQQVLNITDNDRDTAILTLMGLHGLRVDEVCQLSLADLHLEHEPPYMSVTGKGDKTRRVHLVETSIKALRRWLRIRPDTNAPAIFVSQANNTPTGPMTTRGLRYLVDKYLDQAGLKDEGISCHSLRHSFATWSLFGGAKLKAISAEMGHSSITTTERYAKLVDRIKDNPARYLESLLTS